MSNHLSKWQSMVRLLLLVNSDFLQISWVWITESAWIGFSILEIYRTTRCFRCQIKNRGFQAITVLRIYYQAHSTNLALSIKTKILVLKVAKAAESELTQAFKTRCKHLTTRTKSIMSMTYSSWETFSPRKVRSRLPSQSNLSITQSWCPGRTRPKSQATHSMFKISFWTSRVCLRSFKSITRNRC